MRADNQVQAFATLRFMADRLDPDVVTEALGLQPTQSHRKGDSYRLGRRDRDYVARTGVWLLSTKKLVDGGRLEDHIDYLTGVLASRGERLDLAGALAADLGYEVDASCYWYGPAGAAEPAVSDAFRAAVGRLGGEVWVDFHRDDDVEHAVARRLAAA